MENNEHPRAVKLGIWIASTKFGKSVLSSLFRVRLAVFIFILFMHSIYWSTAWWSPWPFIISIILGIWFGQGILKPWSTIISQAMQPEWDSAMLKITIPFVVFNYIAFFACLYMFGTVIDGNGNPIIGIWKHFYFSAVTLTTLGYGNLTPSGTWAEVVATIESVVGFMGFAVLAGVVASIALKRFEISEKA